jgi:hypothetical protein
VIPKVLEELNDGGFVMPEMISLCQIFSRINEVDSDDKSMDMLTRDMLLQEIDV